MGNNASVRRFKTDMFDLVNRAKYNFHQELLAQADELCGDIRNAIPHSDTGHLRDSVRKRDVSSQDGSKLSVLILAGGTLTTKHTEAGSFDYAVAEEFGTRKETPRPFFYSTVRQYRARGDQQFQETFAQTIAENNRLRAARGDVYSSGSGTVTNIDLSGTALRGGTLTRTYKG